MNLQVPFIYFGGKSRVADDVWARFGDCVNYVEPFFGSGAVLLARPEFRGVETVNDMDGMIANFWRSVQWDPDAVARFADWPVNENDLHARHAWLVAQRESLSAKLEGDPDYYDPKIAGWWVWGVNCWIGSGFCSGNGPWRVVDGKLVDTRQLPHVGGGGQGVNRQLPHVGNAGRGVNRQLPNVGNAGQGVNRQLPHVGDAGRGVHKSSALEEWMRALADRLRGVRVCCGDWSRVCGPSVTFKHGMTAVFLDPPYADTAERASNLYTHDCEQVAHQVREWAIENGANPLLRIALCGYDGEHAMPSDWECLPWKARKGYGGQKQSGENDNSKRERIWFSPACLGKEVDLFAGIQAI